VAVEGHSRNGKATLVTAAYDDRVVAALPSCGGEGVHRGFGGLMAKALSRSSEAANITGWMDT
jgi:hypothetical protein